MGQPQEAGFTQLAEKLPKGLVSSSKLNCFQCAKKLFEKRVKQFSKKLALDIQYYLDGKVRFVCFVT
jgi:hypothetical protein